MKDLLLIVPDKNTHFALRGALARPKAMGIQEITFDFAVHPHRDSGVRISGAAIAGLRRSQFLHAVLLFDHEGCGDENTSPEAMQDSIEAQLTPKWGANARTVVISPEVDVWLWGSDNALAEVLRWKEDVPIRNWLIEHGWTFDEDGKPNRPKEAFEKLREVHGRPRSSSLYEEIAGKISLRHCTDPAFVRLRTILAGWFPAAGHG